MKATGIVRRIDDLGRVVIPKEIRRSLRLRNNEPIEIFTDENGKVVLKKYSPIGELNEFAEEYTKALNESLGHTVCITDKDGIIAVSGPQKKQLLNRQVSEDIENLMDDRKVSVITEPIAITINTEDIYKSSVIAPIIVNGDIIGSVIITTKEDVKMDMVEQKMCETAAGFLARQLGD